MHMLFNGQENRPWRCFGCFLLLFFCAHCKQIYSEDKHNDILTLNPIFPVENKMLCLFGTVHTCCCLFGTVQRSISICLALCTPIVVYLALCTPVAVYLALCRTIAVYLAFCTHTAHWTRALTCYQSIKCNLPFCDIIVVQAEKCRTTTVTSNRVKFEQYVWNGSSFILTDYIFST